MTTPFEVRYTSALSIIHPLTIRCSSGVFPPFSHGWLPVPSVCSVDSASVGPCLTACLCPMYVQLRVPQCAPLCVPPVYLVVCALCALCMFPSVAAFMGIWLSCYRSLSCGLHSLFVHYSSVIRSLDKRLHCYILIHFIRFDLRTSTD